MLKQPALAFLSVPESTSGTFQNFDPKMDLPAALVIPQTFLSPSVTGFIHSRSSVLASSSSPKVPHELSQPIEIVQAVDIPDQQDGLQKSGEDPWKCSLHGSLSVLEWQSPSFHESTVEDGK